MAEDLSDDLPLGNGGNDPQRPLMAKRAGSQIEGKYPLQELRPAPVRRGAAGRRLFHTLLARRRDHRLAQRAVHRALHRMHRVYAASSLLTAVCPPPGVNADRSVSLLGAQAVRLPSR